MPDGATVTVDVFPDTGVMPIVGLQLYVPPDGRPVAVSVVFCPAHRFVSADAIVTDAVAWMVSTIESDELHPVILSVTVTWYVVVPAVGLVIVGLAVVVLLRFVPGDHA